MADAALGIVGGVAYDATNLLYTLYNDTDLLGQPVDHVDRAMLALSVALGTIEPFGAKGPALRAIAKAVNSGAISHAAEPTLTKLSQHASGRLIALIEKYPGYAEKLALNLDEFSSSVTGVEDNILRGSDYLKAHPRAVLKYVDEATDFLETLASGKSVKIYMAMPEKYADLAVRQGVGNADAIKYIKDRPGRAGPARSAAADKGTLKLEANRNGNQPDTKVLSAEYSPSSPSDFKIFPSVRNPDGGVNIHHTNIDPPENLTNAFQDVTIIGDLNP